MGVFGEVIGNGDMKNCSMYKKEQVEIDIPVTYYSWIADGFEFHIVLEEGRTPQFIVSSLYGKVLDLGDIPQKVIDHIKEVA